MSFTLRENITAVIETCFSETKEEIQDTAINRILELIRTDKADHKDEPQTCEECEHWSDTEDGCADRHGCTMTERSE